MAKTEFDETTVASIIAEGCSFDGTISVKGSIRVDGHFNGKLTVSETLVIGKTGSLKAEVETKRANIAGTLKGQVNAQDGVKLQAGSRFEGNIFTKNLVIEEGVYFDGGCWRSVESRDKKNRPEPSGGAPGNREREAPAAPQGKEPGKEPAVKQ
jgi:cytoskeletal protein CcmA (bactofilin family)